MMPNDWEKTTLKDLLSTPIKNGYSPNSVEEHTGYFVLGLGALTDRNLNISNIKNVEVTEQVLKTQLSHGDFLISRSNTPDKVGRSVMFRGEIPNCSYPDLMMKFRPEESLVDPHYLELYLQSSQTRQYFKNCAAGSSSSMVKINKSIVEKTPIVRPSLPEQRKIAKILSTWGKAVAATEKLIKTSKQQKIALMQQLLTGKKRLINPKTDKPFEGEWTEVSLGDLGHTYTGLIGKTKDDFGVGAKYIPYMNVFNNSSIKMTQLERVQVDNDEKQNTVQFGDVFFTTSSETPEEVGMSSVMLSIPNEPVYLNSFCFGFRPDSLTNTVPEFMQYLLRSKRVRRSISVLAQGATRYNLSKVQLLKIRLYLPSSEEQQQIASILSLADKDLEILETKLVHLRQEKKALIQNLFTGKVRCKYQENQLVNRKFEPTINIDKVVLKNFRRLEDVTLKLNESNVNVLIGDNGAGKTSILESIALSLSWLVARIKTPNGNGGVIEQSDINVNSNKSSIELTSKVTTDSSSVDYYWRTSVSRNGFTNNDESEYVQLKYLTENIRKSITIDDETSIPLVVYYGIDRTDFNAKFSPLKSKYNRFDAFDYPIYKSASVNGIFDWIHYRENIENETKLGNSGTQGLEALLLSQGLSRDKVNEAIKLVENEDEILSSVKRAICSVIDGITDMFVEREPEIGLFVIKGNDKINVNQLSQGEKILLSLVADISRRLSIINSSGKPNEGKGIVLIDELELHLHPKWQQNIVRKLRETFPNIQFIITTHSPQILSTVRKDEISIINFKGNKCIIDSPLGETYGIASNDALLELMGVDPRPPLDWVLDLKEYLKLIDLNNHTSSEGVRLREALENELGADHFELRKADRKIRRKSLLNK
ncbi:restriction endonuclease subunit S [Vibrio harveyi]